MGSESAGRDTAVGPKGEARRRALLDAAAKLFVTKGFEKTTLSDLVKEAGGSRASIYDLFGCKESLFRAMMAESNHRVLDHMAAVTAQESLPPEQALVRFGTHFIRDILNDECRAVVRVLVAEGGRIPDIAEAFWESGPEVTAGRVADYLRAVAEHGGLELDDPEAAARVFLGMIVGDLFMRSLILPERPLPEDEIDRRVRYSVRLFLNGVRAKSPAPAAPGPAR